MTLTCSRGRILKISVATLDCVPGSAAPARDGAVSYDGNVPNGNFNPDNRQLKFNRNDADNRNPKGGFRLSVRSLFDFRIHAAGLNGNRWARSRWPRTREPANGHAAQLLDAVAPGKEKGFGQQFFFIGKSNEELDNLNRSNESEYIRLPERLSSIECFGGLAHRRENGRLELFTYAKSPGLGPALHLRRYRAI